MRKVERLLTRDCEAGYAPDNHVTQACVLAISRVHEVDRNGIYRPVLLNQMYQSLKYSYNTSIKITRLEDS